MPMPLAPLVQLVLRCHRRLQSAGVSASHCAVASCHTMSSCASSLACCCVISPHAATSHLPASPPLIALLPLIVPLPPVPLVWLVVTLPPPPILLARPCLLTSHLHLPPSVCLMFAPAGCQVSSHCAAFATHPFDVQPPLNAPAGCSNVSCCPASAACPLGALLCLGALPPPPTPMCLSFALARCCITSHCTTPLIVSTCRT
jgi:hypothetical protein